MSVRVVIEVSGADAEEEAAIVARIARGLKERGFKSVAAVMNGEMYADEEFIKQIRMGDYPIDATHPITTHTVH